jgi:membrane-associated phospholipid phosphatase
MAQCFYFIINLTTTSAHDVTTYLDKLIPFNEWFFIPYAFWYIYTFGMLLLLAYFDYKTYYKLLFSIFVGMIICFIIYVVYPTTVPRVSIEPDNLLKKAVLNIIWGNDKPYNCFPSIHMLDTLLITLFLFKHYKSLWIKMSSAFLCVIIYLSTFFIKQHAILDACASTVLAIILFLVFENGYFAKKLESVKTSLRQPKSSFSEDI